MEEAAESYTKVVEMAPQHLEARLSLATLQQQLGRPECALKALESMYDSDTLAQDSSAAQKARSYRNPLISDFYHQIVSEFTFDHVSVSGIKAAASSLHTAEDSGQNRELPGCYDHHDLHAPEGDTQVLVIFTSRWISA